VREIYSRPKSLREAPTHYCAGCGHGIAHRLVAEVIDELNLREKTVGVAPVGCAVLAYNYWDFDVTEAAHGRTPAVATGIKRAHPELFVFTYQGDGDLAAIGTAEIIHAANRGENISVIFINNAVYGMTGGQMAPTTLLTQKTATTPLGRDVKRDGYPLKISEILATLEGSAYIERVSINKPSAIRQAKKAIFKSFLTQIERKGFSLVEILSPCPTYWGLSPEESMKKIDEIMTKVFPLGVLKERD
jgi:2-oxoglutarate ferredoxin oxidoreductase subunit beta